MALKRSLGRGVVAFLAATLVARIVGGKRLDTRIGLLAGGAMAVRTWLSGDPARTAVEIETTTDAAG
jgi:hypothetical protein